MMKLAKTLNSIARAFGAGFGLVMVGAIAALMANQSNTWSPTTGTVTGLQLTTNFNNAFSAIQSCNSGNTAPVNDQTAAAVKGQCWLDTSTTPNQVKMFDGTNWLILGWMDAVNHFWIANNGGNVGTIASVAGTTDIGTVQNPVLSITGTNGITSLGATAIAGTTKLINFTGILTLTHNATSLILPNGGANITTAVGDTMAATALGAGNWRVLSYTRAAGTALSSAANFTSNVAFTGIVSPAALASGTTANYSPAGLATAETLRLTPNAANSTISGIAAQASGFQLTLINIGTANIILTANDTGSTAGNRFQLPGPYTIGPDQSVQLRYDNTTTRWRLVNPQRDQAVAPSARNLKISTPAGSTTATTTVDEINVEDNDGNVQRLQSVSVAPVMTASGVNGLDTGSIAINQWYSVNVIFNPTTNTVAGIYSLQANCQNLTFPAGYTACARVGWVRSDPGPVTIRWLGTVQNGRTAHYVIVSASNTSTYPLAFGPATAGTWGGTDVTVTTLGSFTIAAQVPTTASRAYFIMYNKLNNGTTSNIALAPGTGAPWTGTNNGPIGTGGNTWPAYLPQGPGALQTMPFPWDIESTTIGVVSGGNGGAVAVYGWEDNL